MSGTILESGASRVPESVEPVTVVGAGLAGSECAWQLAERGIPVTLCEMRPERFTPAHHTPDFAELVCSNSLRSDELSNAVGLLKAEMRRMNSLVMRSADHNRVAAGGALARKAATRSPGGSPSSGRNSTCISMTRWLPL